MKGKPLLKELNIFYMSAFLFSGLFVWLACTLGKALALGETEAMLVTNMLVQFSPAAAALLAMRMFPSGARLEKGLRLPSQSWLIVLAPLLAILSQVILLPMFGKPMVQSAFFETLPFIVLSLLTTLLGSVTEEIGWRGYLHGRLSGMMKPWQAAALSSLMWGVWHFTKIFSLGPLAYLLFVLSVLPLGMLMCYLRDKAKGSLLPSILLHTLYNLAFMGLLYERESIPGYLIGFAVLGLLLLALRLMDPLYFQQHKGKEGSTQT